MHGVPSVRLKSVLGLFAIAGDEVAAGLPQLHRGSARSNATSALPRAVQSQRRGQVSLYAAAVYARGCGARARGGGIGGNHSRAISFAAR